MRFLSPYLVEYFTGHVVETTAVINFYRLVVGSTVSFFIVDWEKAVNGPGWVFGMIELFVIAWVPMMVLLDLKGPSIRRLNARLSSGLFSTEESAKLDGPPVLQGGH